jgi:hypothetical protein
MSDEQTTTTPEGQATGTEWWQRELSDVRQEAANSRVKLKETKEAFEAEKAALLAEKTQFESELKNQQLFNMKIKAALAAGVPGESAEEIAELLKGEDLDSMKSHATKLISTFSGLNKSDAPVDHSQGSGSYVPLNGDPLLEDLSKKLGFSL